MLVKRGRTDILRSRYGTAIAYGTSIEEAGTERGGKVCSRKSPFVSLGKAIDKTIRGRRVGGIRGRSGLPRMALMRVP